MQIEARAIRRLQQYFRNIDWCMGKNMRNIDISEEILVDLFRTIGAPEVEEITLNNFSELELAASFERPGYVDIKVELEGTDDFYYFYHHFDADPSAYFSSHTEEIVFSGLRRFKSFVYNPEKKVWKVNP